MSAVRWLVAAVAGSALVLGACGDGGDPAGEGAEVDVELEVTAGVVDEPGSRGSARLTCGPDGAAGTGWLTGEAAEQACARLADDEARAQFEPPPPDQMCAEVYGGPDVATVVGTIDGDAVDASFDRRNGCAISRWDALVPLLPEPVGP